ncbi:MAG: glycosyltransferase family 2 protein [bacterium]|nr:glycosyltransferase family 2 protein [bacterium]
MKLSIIVPCYNEQENIPLILKSFEKVANYGDIEVIIVNNGSTDNSEQVINENLPLYAFAKSIKVDKNQGYGFGVLSGLKVAQGEYIGWIHADMQVSPKELIKVLDIINNENSEKLFIKGSRKNRGLIDSFITFGMSCFESILFKQKLFDINSQPNIFSRDLLKNLKQAPNDYMLDLFVFKEAINQNYKIIRFPVRFQKRAFGVSSWNKGLFAKYKFIKRTIEFSLELKKV